jgi:hypothetical protein
MTTTDTNPTSKAFDHASDAVKDIIATMEGRFNALNEYWERRTNIVTNVQRDFLSLDKNVGDAPRVAIVQKLLYLAAATNPAGEERFNFLMDEISQFARYATDKDLMGASYLAVIKQLASEREGHPYSKLRAAGSMFTWAKGVMQRDTHERLGLNLFAARIVSTLLVEDRQASILPNVIRSLGYEMTDAKRLADYQITGDVFVAMYPPLAQTPKPGPEAPSTQPTSLL